ncbi:conserved hypothetical protein [Ricinus communis]|uniref:Uncharacterized protein n=1 Tax=Ricinus communis TaxID=3988 RepID=B9TAT0_RICCO|nr:conserved hypothetical protein [Ricinus communis]
MVVARSTLVHLRHSARAQPRPVMLWKNLTYCWAGYSEPAIGCRISSQLRKMVKVACFQATALDAHVVIVVGSECLCSILKYYFG